MNFLELYFTNPLEFSSLPVSIYFLVMHIPIILGFGAGSFYIIKYLRRYYGERPIPVEWRYIWLALLWGAFHKLIETLIFYQYITGKVLLIFFIFIQVIGGMYLIRGSYLLAKKYQ